MSSDNRVVERRMLLNNVVSLYEIPSRDNITSLLDFLNEIRTTAIAFIRERPQNKIRIYYMSIEIYVKYWAEIKFVFHCILYFSHVKKVVSAL